MINIHETFSQHRGGTGKKPSAFFAILPISTFSHSTQVIASITHYARNMVCKPPTYLLTFKVYDISLEAQLGIIHIKIPNMI